MSSEQQPLSELIVKPPTTSKDFQTAIYDDWKRKAVDEAKKRACAQASDYETFKNLVSVAHLRPIGEPSCKKGNDCSPECYMRLDMCSELGFNTAALHTDAISTPAARLGRDGQVLPFECSAPVPAVSITSDKVPSTTAEFSREWKRNRNTNRSRYDLFCQLEPSQLLKIFHIELNSMILSEIITACEDCWHGNINIVDGAAGTGDCRDENQGSGGNENQGSGGPCMSPHVILDRLQALVQSKGFGMASRLLSSRTKSSMQLLMRRLTVSATSDPWKHEKESEDVLKSIGELADSFGVKM
jgi:hypothetical protein